MSAVASRRMWGPRGPVHRAGRRARRDEPIVARAIIAIGARGVLGRELHLDAFLQRDPAVAPRGGGERRLSGAVPAPKLWMQRKIDRRGRGLQHDAARALVHMVDLQNWTRQTREFRRVVEQLHELSVAEAERRVSSQVVER